MNRFWQLGVLAVFAGGCAAPQGASVEKPDVRSDPTDPVTVYSTTATQPVKGDPDDPAIWVHRKDPSRSLIFCTDKEGDGIYVFNLDGSIARVLEGVQRPNNVDIELDFELGGGLVDLAVATERLQTRLRIFAIDQETGETQDVSGSAEVFAGEVGEAKAPMGIGLFKRADGQTFAIVGRKEGPKTGYLWTYRLVANGGKVDIEKVKAFGAFSGDGEIEAILVDDELGFVYYADEGYGIRKYAADPDASSDELAVFATQTWKGDREGLALYSLPDGKGYLIATEQIEGDSRYHVFERDGDHALLKIVRGGADSTDGIEATSRPLGENFPSGMLVAMNSGRKNFLLFDWRLVAGTGQPKLGQAK